MNFSKRDLRNGTNPLLRRLQRQMDNQNNKVEPIVDKDFSMLHGKKKGFIEDSFLEKPIVKKQTKLELYKNRSSGRR